MKTFNLFKRPGRLVFLDDDSLFLHVLSLALPKDLRADFFVRPKLLLDFLELNSQHWEADFWAQRRFFVQGQQAFSQIPFILQYWREFPKRYDLVRIAAVDYAMPDVNGLDLFRVLGAFMGSRVLLTGQADEGLAVKAFNQGLIDQFISKQHLGLSTYVMETLQPLVHQPVASYQALWGQDISQNQLSLLSDQRVADALHAWILAKNWVEYAVTGRPFGILGVDARGYVGWLQLELKTDLEDLIELVSDENLPTESLASVLRGESLMNAELCLALDKTRLTFSPAFHVGDQLLAAGYDLGDAYALSPNQSYAAWCAGTPNRVLLD